MLQLLITILVFIIIASVVLYVVRLGLAAIPGGPKPLHNLAYGVVVLILLFVFLNEIGWLGTAHGWRSFR